MEYSYLYRSNYTSLITYQLKPINKPIIIIREKLTGINICALSIEDWWSLNTCTSVYRVSID